MYSDVGFDENAQLEGEMTAILIVAVVIILVVMSAPVVREKTAKLWKQLFPGKAAAKEAV